MDPAKRQFYGGPYPYITIIFFANNMSGLLTVPRMTVLCWFYWKGQGESAMGSGNSQRKAWIDVRALRLSRGWRQQEAADKLGVARSHLSTLENNKCGLSVKMMDAIIRVYGVDYESFYAEESE
jgi:DNA-binding XRE family transcriptional regulator